MKTLALAFGLLVTPTLALADEVWTSPQMGTIVYEADQGLVAILSMPGSHPGSNVYLYVEGMGGNYGNIGTYSGYWIEKAPGDCATERTGADGRMSDNWGLLEITLQASGDGRAFTGRLGACGGAFTDEFHAAP